jgi:non-ribosomal peptide synthetase component F
MRAETFHRSGGERHGDAIAMVDGRCRCTHRDIEAKSDRLAQALSSRGVGPGYHVIVFMDTSWQAAVAILAGFKCAAVVCPVDPSAGADVLSMVLAKGPAALLTCTRRAATARTALAGVNSLHVLVLSGAGRVCESATCLSFEEAVAGIGGGPVAIPNGCDDTALLFPSGLRVSHKELVRDAAEEAFHTASVEALPLASREGISRLLAAGHGGISIVFGQKDVRRHPAASPVETGVSKAVLSGGLA